MAARKAWEDLSAGQRSRYLGAVRSGKATGSPVPEASVEQVARQLHASGDLRAARGHPGTPPAGAAPAAATGRASSGAATDADMAALRKWRRSRAYPKWLPRSQAKMGDDTAAALSRIGVHPSEWSEVVWTYLPGGQVLMTVRASRGRVRSVILPDHDAKAEAGRLINQFSREKLAESPAEARRLKREWEKGGAPPPMTVEDESGTDEELGLDDDLALLERQLMRYGEDE